MKSEEQEKIEKWEEKMKAFNFVKGKMYVSRHTERRKGEEKEYIKVLLCTGRGEMPKWGNYASLSAVVVKNTALYTHEIMMVGSHSHTWNASQFTEEYTEDVRINNLYLVEPCGDCCDASEEKN